MATTPFPNNVLEALEEEFKAIEGIELVAKRPLRASDPNPSIGLMSLDWTPEDMAIGQDDPAVQQYLFAIQALVKHGNEEEGLILHSLLAKMVRTMLYRTESLRVRLAQLNETSFGVTERTLRWGIRRQRFMANEVTGSFMYLSTTEFWLETETV